MSLDVFLKFGILFQIVSETSCILDVTCYSHHARIYITGDNDMFIGGYRSGSDTDALVSFGRKITGTGKQLPSTGREADHRSASVRIFNMPSTGGKQRIGAFYCRVEKDETDEDIATLIMARNSEVKPEHISQTVSIGDPVTLKVITDYTSLIWWHNNKIYNGEGNRPVWNDKKVVEIETVTLADAGIYECSVLNRRTFGLHAIFQVIVRACEAGRWGDSCQFDCPHCYNGGICHERSGECVCAPGFSGDLCKQIHGQNHWGQDGQLTCSTNNDDACRWRLFCLPHPYGCSCSAGYFGIDCNQTINLVRYPHLSPLFFFMRKLIVQEAFMEPVAEKSVIALLMCHVDQIQGYVMGTVIPIGMGQTAKVISNTARN
ncbi:tyrosine-protein kinase receptor Tie-1-like [Amphiura filiformis]|uniref:tyrosine-protein kinase receptor Tie-1-like n=1 Tax=Amphiura filiformis TaxID=82378 RepID=UPI003B21A255